MVDANPLRGPFQSTDSHYGRQDELVNTADPEIVEPDCAVEPGRNITRRLGIRARIGEFQAQQLYRTIGRNDKILAPFLPRRRGEKRAAAHKLARPARAVGQAVQPPLHAQPGLQPVGAAATFEPVLARETASGAAAREAHSSAC